MLRCGLAVSMHPRLIQIDWQRRRKEPLRFPCAGARPVGPWCRGSGGRGRSGPARGGLVGLSPAQLCAPGARAQLDHGKPGAWVQVMELGTRQMVAVPLTKGGRQLGALELCIQHQAMPDRE